MTNEKFTAFIDLIHFDQETAQLRKKIEQREGELKEVHQQESSIATDLEAAHDHWIIMRKEVDENELEMKDLDQQEQEQKRRLDTAKNEKEYRSAKAEIDTLKTKQTELEAKLVGAWHQLDQAEQAYNKQKEEAKQAIEKVQESIKEKEAAIEQGKKELDQHQAERSTKTALVPQEWLDEYAGMAGRVADPAVPVEQNSCSACFYMLSSEDMMSLDKNKLLQCKGCYRFLYAPHLTESQKEVV